jgi:hypothetical protein
MRIDVAKAVLLFAIVSILAWGANVARGDELVLADGGKSAYVIVVADDASPSTKHGAEELQKFLEEMTGVKLPIVSDKQPTSDKESAEKEIILGDNAHFKALNTGIDVASLGKEGYVIRTVGDRLVIVGGSVRGNMYGVYGLLEDHLGCRWFTPDCTRIPKTPKLVIGAIDDRQIPVFEYRDLYLNEGFNTEWCAHNRLNSSNASLGDQHGGCMKFGAGYFVHTFMRIMPPEEFFEEHPEYYSMIDGKRVKEVKELPAQLCCTNSEVVRIVTERVLSGIRSQPEATVFSVSQNDAYEGPNQCECPKCQALAKEEDAQIAPVLQLVNKVAEAVEKEFPDKIIETLAYEWGQKPPKTMRPRKNVVIRLCSGGCCFMHPMTKCDYPDTRAFCADIEAWSKIAPRLWVWDYTTDFPNCLLPFPNHRVVGPNIRFFAEHNVKGVFEEDTDNTPQSEMAALGGYVMAKCLWNPYYDSERAIDEFLEGYYGAAAQNIRNYIDLLYNHNAKANIHVRCMPPVSSEHLTDALLIDANRLWQQAEDSVAADATSLDRVKIARLSVDYAILERARLQREGDLPANDQALALAVERFQPFFTVLRSSAITSLVSGAPLNKDAYQNELGKVLQLNVTP